MSPVAILFPGQGSQYTGMGQEAHRAHASVRARFEQASDIVGYSVEHLCFEATPAELTRTAHAQVALLVLSYALYEVLERDRHPRVSCMAGHSLGEITALAAAGALSFEDAVALVKARGEAMDRCAATVDSGMIAALDLPAGEVARLVHRFNVRGHDVRVANDNGPTQTVLAGSRSSLKDITPFLEDAGVRVALLNVAGAFHSPYMADAVEPFVEATDACALSTPRVPVFSTVRGRVYRDADDIREALAVQLTSPVLWRTVVQEIARREPAAWLEVGPKTVLTKMVSRILGDGQLVAGVDGEPAELERAFERLSAAEPGPSVVALCLGAAAATRNRGVDDAAYATGVIAPYRELADLNNAAPGDEPSDATGRRAIGLLRTIMQTKLVPSEEQEDRIGAILGRTGNHALAAELGVVVR